MVEDMLLEELFAASIAIGVMGSCERVSLCLCMPMVERPRPQAPPAPTAAPAASAPAAAAPPSAPPAASPLSKADVKSGQCRRRKCPKPGAVHAMPLCPIRPKFITAPEPARSISIGPSSCPTRPRECLEFRVYRCLWGFGLFDMNVTNRQDSDIVYSFQSSSTSPKRTAQY